PDGSQVCVGIFDPRVGTPDVWIYDVKRNLRTRFTTDTAADNNPIWSPDGTRIVFASTRRGHVDLFMKSIGGSKPEELLYSGSGDNFPGAWSPDGKYLISTQLITGGGWNVMRVPIDGGEPAKLFTISTGFGVSFSPDGRWVTYDSNDSGTRETYVVPFQGSGRKWQISTAGGFAPRWVGNHVYYYNDRALMRTEVTGQGETISVGGEETISVGRKETFLKGSDLKDSDVTGNEKKLLLLQPPDEANKTPLSVVLNWTQNLPATK